MCRDNHHKLLIWLLAMVVIFAPMQAAVSAIDMFDHHRGPSPHCQMDKMDHAKMDHVNQDQSGMGQGNCCQQEGVCQGNCSSCTQCISAPAMLFVQTLTQNQPAKIFVYIKTSLVKGISSPSDYRPPRSLS